MAAVTSHIPWILRRPTTTTGWVGWLVTVDHKRIGVLYGVTAVVFFLIGGIEALTLRLQLASSGKLPGQPGRVQPAVHHACADHDLLGHNAAERRFLQYRCPIADRRKGRRFSPPQRIELLGFPLRRNTAERRLVYRGCSRSGMVCICPLDRYGL